MQTMPEFSVAKALILTGLLLVLIGLAIAVGGRVGLGRLPGDIVYRSDRFTFYFPLATCILLSAIGTLLLWVLGRFMR